MEFKVDSEETDEPDSEYEPEPEGPGRVASS